MILPLEIYAASLCSPFQCVSKRGLKYGNDHICIGVVELRLLHGPA
jgi:hypothetical protein